MGEMNFASAFTKALEAEGLTVDDILLVTENRLIANATVKTIKEAGALFKGFIAEGRYPKNVKRARLLLGDNVSEYEIRVAASILQVREENPTAKVTIADIAKIFQVSRQAVSRNLSRKKINFEELKKRLL